MLGGLPPRLPESRNSVGDLHQFTRHPARWPRLQGAVVALRAGAVEIARPQRIAARRDGFAPVAGGAGVVHGGWANGHGLLQTEGSHTRTLKIRRIWCCCHLQQMWFDGPGNKVGRFLRYRTQAKKHLTLQIAENNG